MLNQDWRKSTLSMGNGECIEVRLIDNHVELRNDKAPENITRYTRSEWIAFVGGAKLGEFDI